MLPREEEHERDVRDVCGGGKGESAGGRDVCGGDDSESGRKCRRNHTARSNGPFRPRKLWNEQRPGPISDDGFGRREHGRCPGARHRERERQRDEGCCDDGGSMELRRVDSKRRRCGRQRHDQQRAKERPRRYRPASILRDVEQKQVTDEA